MARDRPTDFAQACRVDEAVRDWSQIMVKEPVYVSDTLKPLSDLATEDRPASDYYHDIKSQACDAGYCFV